MPKGIFPCFKGGLPAPFKIPFSHCVSWLTSLFLQGSCSLCSKLDRWCFNTHFIVPSQSSFIPLIDWKIASFLLRSLWLRGKIRSPGWFWKRFSAKSPHCARSITQRWNLSLHFNFLVLTVGHPFVLKSCAISGSNVGGKLIVQETLGREFFLSRDTVDALLLCILEASFTVLLSADRRELMQQSESSLMQCDRC